MPNNSRVAAPTPFLIIFAIVVSAALAPLAIVVLLVVLVIQGIRGYMRHGEKRRQRNAQALADHQRWERDMILAAKSLP